MAVVLIAYNFEAVEGRSRSGDEGVHSTVSYVGKALVESVLVVVYVLEVIFNGPWNGVVKLPLGIKYDVPVYRLGEIEELCVHTLLLSIEAYENVAGSDDFGNDGALALVHNLLANGSSLGSGSAGLLEADHIRLFPVNINGENGKLAVGIGQMNIEGVVTGLKLDGSLVEDLLACLVSTCKPGVLVGHRESLGKVQHLVCGGNGTADMSAVYLKSFGGYESVNHKNSGSRNLYLTVGAVYDLVVAAGLDSDCRLFILDYG